MINAVLSLSGAFPELAVSKSSVSNQQRVIQSSFSVIYDL
ncbi:hypothetical protein SAMN06265348_114128 [Pedobacter westerhofensis]|uniref:Uncharacterized protein n=1 Tax=Pedobacter westerhofensis TaxID=425512 RepID=A0A521FNC5_9SPHI|nr:hypothetical protein SAMN06265348_114128 [Pedobacter westerhofensis]